MMKNVKRVLSAVMAVAIMAVGMSGMSVSASTTTSNFTDIQVAPAMNAEWRYNIPARSKDTATKAQVYVSSAYIPVNFRVCGYRNSTVGSNCTLDNSGNKVSSIQITQSNSVKINNYIRSSYNYAILGYSSSSTYSGVTMAGNWAPDTTVNIYNPNGY